MFGPEEIIAANSENESTEMRLTSEQKLGMIISVIKDKMDTQQLKHAIREIRNILES